VRSFRVDGTPPQVVTVTPTTLNPKSVVKATFSERVSGVSGKTMKLYRVVHKKRHAIDAVVSTAKHGKVAKLDPKHNLRSGHYLVVFKATKIMDQAGNQLVPSSAAPAMKAAILAVGSELLGTDRLDTNSLHITKALGAARRRAPPEE